jgi:hypothetical protein
MNDEEQPLEIQSPSQRVFAVASIACFFSLIIFNWVASSVVHLIAVPWIELLVYTILPISVTFTILYRSSWHREISAAKRTYSLFLLSCAILGGVVIASGITFCVALFCFNALSGGNH